MRAIQIKFIAILIVFGYSNTLLAQLSGSYKVGADEIFVNMKDAADSLNSVGVNGLVKFEIKNGVYQDQFTVKPLLNYSLGDSVVITSESQNHNDVKYNHNGGVANNYIVKLDGAEHVTISHIAFLSANASYSNLIVVTNGASYNTVDNCRLEGPQGNGYDMALLHDVQSSMKENYNTYSNNIFIGGYTCLAANGDSNNEQEGTRIIGNSFSQAEFAIVMGFHGGGEIKNNVCNGQLYLDIDSTFYLTGNKIKTTSDYCLRVVEHDELVTKGNLYVYNNEIITGSAHAFELSQSQNVKIYHNTIINNDVIKATFKTSAVDAIYIKNNIIINKAFNEVLYLSGSAEKYEINYNVYHSGNGRLGSLNEVASNNFAEWKLNNGSFDANSTFTEPIFVSNSNYALACGNGQDLQSSFIAPGVNTDKNGAGRNALLVWKGAYNVDMNNHTVYLDGFVANETDTIRAGKVELYGDASNNVLMEKLASSDISSNGYYGFFAAPYLSNYWIKIIPDDSQYSDYLISYQDGVLRWDDAISLSLSDSCNGNQFSIMPRKIESIESGSFTISGTVNEISGSNKTMGTDPIPGLDVVLDKIPPSKSVAYTQTDEYGNYSFDGLPDGIYVVTIEYAGLPADTLYEIELAGESITDLDYCVDTLDAIHGCSPGINTTNEISLDASIYPNPFNDQIQINSRFSIIDVNVYDAQGKLILLKKNVAGNSVIQTAHLNSGVYFIEVINENERERTVMIKK